MADENNTVEPALAGAAVYQGLPIIAGPVLSDLPHTLATLVASGNKIDAPMGTPLSRIAEFTRAEVDAIKGFARQQGVTIPIVAGGPGGEGAMMVDNAGPLRKLLLRITGELPAGTPDVVPHIALNQASVPHALHEIGHASPIAGSDRLRRIFQGLGKAIGQGSMTGNVLRAAIAGNVFAPPDENASGVRRFVYDQAPALVGATMVPELLEEGRASLKALRGARQFGPGIGRTLLELVPAYGTYVAGAAAPVLATILAKRIVQALRKRNASPTAAPEEKNASAAPGAEVKAPGVLRASAASAWKIGENPPKPKTIGPNSNIGSSAAGRAPAKPPSKTAYYKDMLDTLYNPQRGSRLATPS